MSLLFVIKIVSKYAHLNQIFYHKIWSETEIVVSYTVGNQDTCFPSFSLLLPLLFKNHALENLSLPTYVLHVLNSLNVSCITWAKITIQYLKMSAQNTNKYCIVLQLLSDIW